MHLSCFSSCFICNGGVPGCEYGMMSRSAAHFCLHTDIDGCSYDVPQRKKKTRRSAWDTSNSYAGLIIVKRMLWYVLLLNRGYKQSPPLPLAAAMNSVGPSLLSLATRGATTKKKGHWHPSIFFCPLDSHAQCACVWRGKCHIPMLGIIALCRCE